MVSILHSHRQPLLLRFRWLLGLARLLRLWLLLRNHYIQRALRLLAGTLPPQATILDLGSGPGDHALSLAARRPDLLLTCLDREPHNLQTLSRLGGSSPNLQPVLADAALPLPFPDNSFHAAICLSVLQYLPHPADALHELARTTKSGGHLLLYLPLPPKRLFPEAILWAERHSNTTYDALHSRQHNAPLEVWQQWLATAGWQVRTATVTYGFWGKLHWELNHLGLQLAFGGPWLVRPIALFFWLLTLPVQLVGLALDPLFSARRVQQLGNGWLAVLENVKER